MRETRKRRQRGYFAAVLVVAFAAAMLFAAPLTAHAFDGTESIYGTVTDADTGQPLENVELWTEYYDADSDSWYWVDAYTDGNGDYAFYDLPAGDYGVTVDYEGYESGWADVTYDGGTPYLRDFELSPAALSVTGEVTDADTGAPIDWANVYADYYDAGDDAWYWAGDASIDENGVYSLWGLPAGDIEVYVSAYGYYGDGASLNYDGSTTLYQNFALAAAPAAVYGTVTDADTSDPIWDAEVSCMEYNEEWGWEYLDETWTDENGEYELLFGADAGSYDIFAYADRYEDMNATVTYDGMNAVEQNFPMTPLPVSVYGTVTDASTTDPIESARVGVLNYDAEFEEYYLTDETYTDENGDYSIVGLEAGEYEIEASSYTYEASVASGVTFDGATPVLQDFALEPAERSVYGTVSDAATGEPIYDAYVELGYFDGSEYYFYGDTWTDENGDYEFYGAEPGLLTVFVEQHGYEDAEEDVTYVGVPTRCDVELVAADPVVTGTVTDGQTGAPLVGAYVWCGLYDSDWDEWYQYDWGYTDENGDYVLYEIPEGASRLFVEERGYETAEYDIDYDGVTPIEHDFALVAADPAVFGQVLDADTSDPIVGAGVTAQYYDAGDDMWYDAAWWDTDENGEYELYGLDAGDYRLAVTKWGFVDAYVDITYDGSTPIQRDFLLDHAVPTFTGTLTDADSGEPLEGVRVTVWEPDLVEWSDISYTDAQGAFAMFEALPGGNYTIIVEKFGYETLYEDVVFDGSTTVERTLELVPLPTAFTGTVTNAVDSTALEGASVYADEWNGEYGEWWTLGGVSTYADGSYTMRLPNGDYRLRAVKDGFDEESVDVSFNGTDAVDQDFGLFPSGYEPNPLTGTMVLNNGAATVNVATVLIQSNVPDAVLMRIRASNTNGASWGSWTPWWEYDAEIDMGIGTTTSGTWTYQVEYEAADGRKLVLSDSIYLELLTPGAYKPIPVQGNNRYQTAVAASKTAFPAGAPVVVIATGTNWPDALGGASLAAAKGGPILLTSPTSLPADVLSEITRLGAKDAIVLGAKAAVSDSVFNALQKKLGTGHVKRLGGANRYETANLVAKETVASLEDFDGTCFVGTGLNFPDALGASPLAAAKGWPIFLSAPTGVTPATSSAMKAVGVKKVLILGGTGAVSGATETALKKSYTVERLKGDNRYATARAVATYGVANAGLGWDRLALATGENFPDALAGGVLQGKDGSVMLLTTGKSLCQPAAQAITANKAKINTVRYLGGTSVLTTTVRNQVKAILTAK